MKQENKKCNKCGESKPASEYYKRKGTCKPCYKNNVTAHGWNLRPKKDDLKNTGMPWTDDDNKIIRLYYPIEKPADVAKRLGRSLQSTKSQAHKLRVKNLHYSPPIAEALTEPVSMDEITRMAHSGRWV
jgi:hypothetical protein